MDETVCQAMAAVAAPLLALAFFLILSRVTYFRYENSDDFLIVRAFLGFEGVSPSLPHFHLHPLLVWALSLLSAAVPGVAWFSVLQLALLWLSAATLCLSLLCCGRPRACTPPPAWQRRRCFWAYFPPLCARGSPIRPPRPCWRGRNGALGMRGRNAPACGRSCPVFRSAGDTQRHTTHRVPACIPVLLASGACVSVSAPLPAE